MRMKMLLITMDTFLTGKEDCFVLDLTATKNASQYISSSGLELTVSVDQRSTVLESQLNGFEKSTS
jgi:hypothetical protein